MSSSTIVQILAIAMALILVLRAMRARNLSTAQLIRWSAIWVAIIAAIAVVAQLTGLTTATHVN